MSKHRTKLGTLMYEAFVGEEERKKEKVEAGRELLFESRERCVSFGSFPASLPAHNRTNPCQQTSALIK